MSSINSIFLYEYKNKISVFRVFNNIRFYNFQHKQKKIICSLKI